VVAIPVIAAISFAAFLGTLHGNHTRRTANFYKNNRRPVMSHHHHWRALARTAADDEVNKWFGGLRTPQAASLVRGLTDSRDS
jgi:hypothetical protein